MHPLGALDVVGHARDDRLCNRDCALNSLRLLGAGSVVVVQKARESTGL